MQPLEYPAILPAVSLMEETLPTEELILKALRVVVRGSCVMAEGQVEVADLENASLGIHSSDIFAKDSWSQGSTKPMGSAAVD